MRVAAHLMKNKTYVVHEVIQIKLHFIRYYRGMQLYQYETQLGELCMNRYRAKQDRERLVIGFWIYLGFNVIISVDELTDTIICRMCTSNISKEYSNDTITCHIILGRLVFQSFRTFAKVLADYFKGGTVLERFPVRGTWFSMNPYRLT